MNEMLKYAAAASLVLAFAGTGTAMADDDCHAPMDQWQPRAAVERMAEARGWQVSRIKIDGGCYEIKGTDEKGRTFKAKIDPATLATVRMKHKDGQGASQGGRDRPQRADTGGGGAVPSGGLFKTGKPPTVEVK